MSKQTFRNVLLSSFCFLCFIYITSFYIPKEITTPVTKEVKNKVVYLTFDDGPSKNTQAILDILEKHKVKATFFVSGQNPEYFMMIGEEHKKQHMVAAHTYSHDFKTIYSNEEAYFSDLNKINDVIKQYTGKQSKIVRFPGGSSNTISRHYQNGIMRQLASALQSKGFLYYDWNATNGDGGCSTNSSAMINQAIRESKNQDEVMLLMHDGTCNSATIEALPQIIEHFKDNGYTFKTIDNATKEYHQTIVN